MKITMYGVKTAVYWLTRQSFLSNNLGLEILLAADRKVTTHWGNWSVTARHKHQPQDCASKYIVMNAILCNPVLGIYHNFFFIKGTNVCCNFPHTKVSYASFWWAVFHVCYHFSCSDQPAVLWPVCLNIVFPLLVNSMPANVLTEIKRVLQIGRSKMFGNRRQLTKSTTHRLNIYISCHSRVLNR